MCYFHFPPTYGSFAGAAHVALRDGRIEVGVLNCRVLYSETAPIPSLFILMEILVTIQTIKPTLRTFYY